MAARSVELSFLIKLLGGNLAVAMPRQASAMQLLSAKNLLHCRNIVAVKQSHHPLPRLAAHKQFGVGLTMSTTFYGWA